MSVRKHSYLDGTDITITRNPQVVCKDGFVMSVQVGESLYSTPKSYTTEDYAAAEVGFPSERESLLDSYAEGFCDEDDDFMVQNSSYLGRSVQKSLTFVPVTILFQDGNSKFLQK